MNTFTKRILIYSMIFVLVFPFLSVCAPGASLTAYAHSGRTDANGGHRDNKNVSGLGPYHYHHGYSAHLHENGICPYESSQAAQSISVSPESTAPAAASPALPTAPAIDYSKVFDAGFYAAANPDLVAVYGTDSALLFQHFLTSGMAEGRQANALFNVRMYQAAHPELAATFGENLALYYTYYCMTNS